MQAGSACILISWNGRAQPFECLAIDAVPEFELVLFDYSGTVAAMPASSLPCTLISKRTECKGQIFSAFANHLAKREVQFAYVALIDDDIQISIATINRLLSIAKAENFDVFAPSLSHSSFYSHKQFLQQPSVDWHSVPWIEVMMPFYKQALFMAARAYFENSISSYGIDQFAFAMLQQLTGMQHVAVIDAVVVTHGRAISSDKTTFSNGLTAHQERRAMRRRCMQVIACDHPELLGSAWYYKTFAPLNGPLRFWTAYLAWPWHKVRRRFS